MNTLNNLVKNLIKTQIALKPNEILIVDNELSYQKNTKNEIIRIIKYKDETGKNKIYKTKMPKLTQKELEWVYDETNTLPRPTTK